MEESMNTAHIVIRGKNRLGNSSFAIPLSKANQNGLN